MPLLGLLIFGFALNRSVVLAVLIGFLGVSLVLQPGPGAFEPAALIGLLGGVFGGLAVVLWRMPSGEHPGRIAFFFALIGVALSAIPVLASKEWPDAGDWTPLLMLGVFSTAAHLLFALGCLIAPADRVITLDYTAVLFASALGWLIWSEAPGPLARSGRRADHRRGDFSDSAAPSATADVSEPAARAPRHTQGKSNGSLSTAPAASPDNDDRCTSASLRR